MIGSVGSAEDWPRFLGVNDNATSGEGRLLKEWPEEGLKVVWEITTGAGYTCPVIADDRLVYLHRVDGNEVVECLDPATGKKLWRFAYAVTYQDRYGFSAGPRASPVIDGDRVYTVGVTARMHCLDVKTGRVLWERDLMKDYAVPQYFFGYGPTPVVWKDRLIVNVGGKVGPKGVCVAALDKTTGKTLWEVQDEWGASYASPVVVTLRGKDCALVMAGGESKPAHGGLLTIDAETGKVYDRFPWRARKFESVIASTPLVVAENRVFVSECYEKGGAVLEFDSELRSRTVWTQREFGMHWMMPLVIGEHIYGFAGRNTPDVEFKCAKLGTGEMMWSDEMQWEANGRVEGLFRGSLLQADGRVFALGEDGILAELELSPAGVVTKQKTRLFVAREAWTLPALSGGRLYVCQNTRDGICGKGPRLICYDFGEVAER